MRIAAGLEVGDEALQGAGDAVATVGQMTAETLARVVQPRVEAQVGDLLLEAARDVVDAEGAGARMLRLGQVKEMGIRGALPQAGAARRAPRRQPGLAEVERWVPSDVGEGGQVALLARRRVQVVVVLGGREQR